MDTTENARHGRIHYSFQTKNWNEFGKFYIVCIYHCHKYKIPGNAFDLSIRHYQNDGYIELNNVLTRNAENINFVSFTEPTNVREQKSARSSAQIEQTLRYAESYRSSAEDNSSDGCIGVDGYSNTQGGKEYGSKLAGWIFQKFDIRDPHNTGLFIGHIYGRPNEKEDMYNQILLASEYYGFPAYFEFVADDWFTYFKVRGRLGYLPLFPRNAIDPVKLKKDVEGKDRHRGFPTTPFALTKSNDAMMTYVEHHCDKIYYEELLDDLPKFRPYKRTPSDRTVSAMITLVSSMEVIIKPPPKKFALIEVYAN